MVRKEMKLGDVYRHKECGNLIKIESFATHINENLNPFNVVIVFANLEKLGGAYGYAPSFNGYGTKEEIEEQYELLVAQEDLNKYSSWEEVFELAEKQK